MENIVKLLLGFAFIIFVAYLVFQIFEQASSDTYLSLSAKLEEVEAGNHELSKKNDLLRIKIDSLRSDNRSIEKQIRDELGLVRADEVLILFKEP